MDVPVPTSRNQRATQVLASRTNMDSAAPTIVDPRPTARRDERPTRRDEAAPSKRNRPRNPVTARLRARVLELTAEMKTPVIGTPPERQDPLQVTTADQLAAMEDLDKTTELDLGAAMGGEGDPSVKDNLPPEDDWFQVETDTFREKGAPTTEQPAVQVESESAPAPAPETGPESAPEPEPESEPEPEPESAPESVPESAPAPETAPAPAPESAPEPEPAPVPEREEEELPVEPEAEEQADEAAPRDIAPFEDVDDLEAVDEPPTEEENIEQLDLEPLEDEAEPEPADEQEVAAPADELEPAAEHLPEPDELDDDEVPERDPIAPTEAPPRDFRDTLPPGHVAQPEQYYPLSRKKDTEPYGVEPVVQPPQEEDGWLPSRSTPAPVLYEGNRRDNEQTRPFMSPWARGAEQDKMALPDEAHHHPAHRRDVDQGLSEAGLLGGPQRVEIRQVRTDRPHQGLVMRTSPSSSTAEQYRVLSLKLKENVHVRCIGVMSPTGEEGSALVGANLALALAEGNRSRVCLVDGDMRQSKMARLLGLKEGPTLARQVRLHRRDPEAPWVALGMGSAFHVIPGDRDDPNPAELLNSEAIFDLMDELRRVFDYIIITPPPLLESADGAILQEHTDGVILAARTRVTRQDAMKSSLKHLNDGKVLGTVLLDAPRRTRG